MSTIERALEKQQQLEAEREAQEREKAAQAGRDPADGAHEGSPRQSGEASVPAEKPAEKTASMGSSEREQTSKSTDTAKGVTTDGEASEEQAAVMQIDLDLLEQQGFVTPKESFSKIKEEYRYIKRPLLNNAFGANASTLRNPNLIMVSSSFSGEGKTFTAINLAISMALEEDRNVLLVDADVVNPHVCERLRLPERPGLMDFLRGNSDVSDIINDTSIPKLKLVTAGTRHHHASEMLAGEKMKRFMSELSTRYPDRVVVFDTAPLLGASETHVLSQHAGQWAIVVEEGQTTQPQLDQALRLLSPDVATNLILNKASASGGGYYGYYYAAS